MLEKLVMKIQKPTKFSISLEFKLNETSYPVLAMTASTMDPHGQSNPDTPALPFPPDLMGFLQAKADA